MKLEKIIINNYCSCYSIDMDLSEFNPIVGYNNSGKSNILKAIKWLLKKSVLTQHQFYDITNAVIVEGTISGVTDALTLLPANQQTQVLPYIFNDQLQFRRKQTQPNVPTKEIKLEVLNPTTGDWNINPTGLDTAIGVLFPEPIYIEAMEVAAEDVGKFTAKNTIGLLLKYTLEQIKSDNSIAVDNLQSALQNVSDLLNGANRINQLTSLEEQATSALGSFFPDLNVHLNIATPNLDELVKGATLDLSDSTGTARPFTSYGHGTQRTVQMAMIKLLADQVRQGQSAHGLVVLLIDEPELYLHPQAIEILKESLKTLSESSFQVIFSTHSALLTGKEEVFSTNIVLKSSDGKTSVRNKLETANLIFQSHPHQASIYHSLQNAAYLLFSEKIILVEGKTEEMLIPEMYKATRGTSLAHDKVCIVAVSGSSSITPMLAILRSVGFTPKSIVDLDFIFRHAMLDNIILASDPNIVACIQWFSLNFAAMKFKLDSSGLPMKGDEINPEKAFELLAKNMPRQIEQLHTIMLENNFWVWKKGAIETYLGIQKNDTSRISFLNVLKTTKNLNHTLEPVELQTVINWL